MIYARRCSMIAAWLTSFACATAVGDDSTPLAGLRIERPRLLFTADEQIQVQALARTDELLACLVEQNHVNAIAMLDEPTVRYEIPDGKRPTKQEHQNAGTRILTIKIAGRPGTRVAISVLMQPHRAGQPQASVVPKPLEQW